MAHLTIHVLGELQVLLDGVPVQSFESDKVRALLAYLVVEADRPHSREALIGLLWPDCTEEAARHNLRQALFNLRLALGDHTAKPPYLLISRSSIQFNQESDYSLDLTLFNDHFSKWEKNRSQESPTPTIAVSQLEEMVDLYRGEFLHHFYIADSTEFEDWIVVQRETSRQQIMEALNHLANQLELLEDYQAARRYAERQLELDPWREEAHYQIMRILALDGQRSAALAQFESCKRILATELGVEPSTKTGELYEQIRSGTLKAKDKSASQISTRAVPTLPIPITPFFGREQELLDLARMLADPECRCITLVGPGGIGKTRLALQVANHQKHIFADGSAFIPLASVESIDAVIPTIANAIHFAFCGPSDQKIQLLNYLRDKHMLLIVDNVEHLLVENPDRATVAEPLIEILQQAVKVKLLVTSREALNIQGEWLFEVQGLSFPGSNIIDGLNEYSAVALFVQRAQRAYSGSVLNEEDKNSIFRICRLVEGLPLAVELAATWMRVLSPMEIAKEIEHSLDFLNVQTRDLPERHRSMRAVFDHSWQMLSMDERKALSRLSVFRGGFQRQAAETVAGASLPVLSSLLVRSLLRRTETGRYDLHELIQQYAASKLAEDTHELYSVQERHSLYYLGLLEEKDPKLRGNDQQDTLAELTKEIDNIRAAWDWSVANQKFMPVYRVSFTLCYLFALHNWFTEGEVTFWKTADVIQTYLRETGQEDSGQQNVLYAMLAHCGYFRFRLGKGEEAYAILAPSAAFLRTSTELSAAIYSLWYLGIVYLQLGRFVEAKESLLESQAISRKCGENWFQALIDEFLGGLAHGEGAYNQAQVYLRDALTIFRQVGDPMMTSHGLSELGHIMQILGDLNEAEKLLQEGLELARELDYCRFGVALALDGLGQVAHARGNHERAGTLLSESASLFREIGDTHRLSKVLNYRGLNYLALDDITEAKNAFITALRMAYEGGLIPTELDALMGLATVDLRQSARLETLELICYILQHPASAQETRNLAARLQMELEARLPQEEIEVAHQRAGSKTLDEFVDPILASFHAR